MNVQFILQNQHVEKVISIENYRLKTVEMRSQTTDGKVSYETVDLFTINLIAGSKSQKISACELEVESFSEESNQVKFTFYPYEVLGATLFIRYETRLAGTVFSSKVEAFSRDASDNIILDYVELDSFAIEAEKYLFSYDQSYTLPDSAWRYPASEMLLGQPVYIKGFFLGSEFPANDNYVDDKGATQKQIHLRYYSGQVLNQFTPERPFESWTSIVGASSSATYEGVQKDFFAYLQTFATPAKMRIQYNSWYEAFMGITEKRFIELAKNMHEEAVKHHLPAFDAYVLDDGWNNYNDPTYTGIDEFRSGKSYNQSGFWEFNDKFPEQATTIEKYLESIGTTLGLWLGPQGGYELQDTFAQYLESVGSGKVNYQAGQGQAIDTNDKIYLDKLEHLMLDLQTKLKLSYWKFDGFASRPSTRTDANHLVGGTKNRYYTTQLWERWINIFKALRAQNPAIFLNLTSYVPNSPWFLNYGNALWLQISSDYERDLTAPGTQAEQAITGRDKIYYQKVFVEKVQLPLCYYFNHEPIYGAALDNAMTDAEFKATLLTNAMRGPALWELHLSPQLLNEAKWDILADTLNWTKQNYAIIQSSKMFLAKDNFMQGYGYLAEKEGHGFLYVRNPSATPQVYNFKELLGNGRIQLLEILSGGRRDILSGEDLTLPGLGYIIYQF